MKNFKYAIEGMIKRPLMFLIILCQIIVGVSIINTGLEYLFKTQDNEKAIRNTFDISQLYILGSAEYGDSFNDNNVVTKNVDEQLLFYNYLFNNEKFKYCVASNSNLIIKDFTAENKFYYIINKKYNSNPYDDIYGNFSDVKALYVDKNYNDNFKFQTKDGRSFTEEDFEATNNKDYVPIILGNNYSGIYKVNDEFQVFDFLNKELRKVKVVGLLIA